MPRPLLAVAVALALTGHPGLLAAQAPLPEEWQLPVAKLRLDFAVPDAPAFALLGQTPSKIIRPTSVREFGLAASNFVGGGSALSIPKSFAVEFAPALILAGPRLTVPAYQRAPETRSRYSHGATARGEGVGEPFQLGVGIRVALIDAADLRQQMPYREAVSAFAAEIVDIQVAARRRLGPMGGRPIPLDSLNADERARLDAVHAKLAETQAGWLERKWNARALDLAFGARASGRDSTPGNLFTDRWGAWLTYADGIRSWGQILVGLTAGAERDSANDSYHKAASASTRLYVGANYYKFFLEGQGTFAEDRSAKWLLHSGGELKLPFEIWVGFSAGLERDSEAEATKLVSHVTAKFAFPRN
jgi:hypothetical protein